LSVAEPEKIYTPKPCATCASGLRQRVDEMLRGGIGVRDIAADTGISKSAIGRHRTKCWAEVPKRPNTKGMAKKALTEAQKVSARRDKYITALEEEVSKGNAIVAPETGQVVVPGFGVVKCPIRDSDDLVNQQYKGLTRVWKVLEQASLQYEEDPSPGRAKIVLAAFHEWNAGLMAIGKVKGIVTDAATTTNQTLNVYASLSDEDLARKRSEIKQIIALATAKKEPEGEVIEGTMHEV
jgi:hypothetical protein